MIRGSLSTSVPGRVYALLKGNGGMRRAEIGQALDASPNAVSVALVNLCQAGALRSSGKRNQLVYTVTALDYPIHEPKPPAPLPPPRQPKVATPRPPKQAKRMNEPAPPVDDNFYPKDKPHRIEEPVRVLCDDCDRFGAERGCKDCTWSTD